MTGSHPTFTGGAPTRAATAEAPCGLFCAFFLDQPAGGGVRQVCGEWRPGQPAGRGRTAWLPAGGGEGAFGGRSAAARSGGPLTRAPPCESRRGQARTVVSRCRRRLVPGGGGAALVGRRRGDCAGCRPPRTGGTDGSSVRERALPEAPCGLFCAFFLDQPAGGGVRQVCGEWRPGQPAGRGRTAWLPAGGNRSFSGLLSGWATGSESDRVRDAAGDWTRGQPDCCAARARLSS